jgi:AraC-like DNA-binding protein
MSSTQADFFRYLPYLPEAEDWGLAVTAGGRVRVGPGESYPPAGHPNDHQLAWDKGRVLGAWQIVFIISGRGRFESAATKPREVVAGTAILLFPGVWHRYAPDAATGWNERWIELRGPVLKRLQKSGLLLPAEPLRTLGKASEAEGLFSRIHERLREPGSGFDPEPGAWALQLLARLHAATRRHAAAAPMTRVIARAEQLLAERIETPPAMEALAKELGVAYSHFRREFKTRTGLPPKQYLLRLRLEKARRLLGNTPDSIKAIADRLGFNSPFHLSAAFKNEFGVAPARWRRAGHEASP